MHEDLLRHIWSKQLFHTSRLLTTDGRVVQIIDPGTLSRKSGPDFRDGKIEIGGTTFTGDIEFHRTYDDWNLHHHQHDQNYNSVILHVVVSGKTHCTPAQSGRTIPTLILEPFLLSSTDKIEDWLAREEYFSRKKEIRCLSLNDTLDAALLNDWIRTLYRERLQEKVLRLHERLCNIILHQQRVIGEPLPAYNETVDDIPIPHTTLDKLLFKQKIAWEQLLYEEVMDGFGYSNNREPMKKISECVSLIVLINAADGNELSALQLEAILFKASGLLPAIHELIDQDSKVYLHSLNTAWNELPNKISLESLHHTEWNFSPTRPANFPAIRIAAASLFLQKLLYQSLFKSIVMLVSGKFSPPQSKIEQLVKLFKFADHPFWNYHYSFSESTQKKHAILGDSRTFDIIVNTIVPFVGLYAHVFGKEDIFEQCLNMAFEIPLLEDNSILRIMNKQLVKEKLAIEFAYQQQGLIQLHKRYCVVERCNECVVGKKIFT